MGAGGLTALAAAAGAVLALAGGCGGDAPAAPPTNGAQARVDSVRDGDTILLTSGLRVRLVQVDAPELASECYGDEAARALERLAPRGATIRLEPDDALDRTDRHGRLLRYGHVAGRNLGLELVRAGAAAPYFYRGTRGRYAQALEAAARRARAGRLGLWGACPSAMLEPTRPVTTGVARRAAR